MAKKTKIGLPETKGTFQLKGVVTGVGRDNFYKEGKTKNGNSYRMINFGVRVDDESVLFLSLFGSVIKDVYFSKKVKDGDKYKYETKPVAWKDRKSFGSGDWNIIGMNLGLEKTTNDSGKLVNNIKKLVQYDGCGYIQEALKDGMNVFVKGKIEYQHYKNDNGELVRTEKLVPNQISLCQDIDFESKDFKRSAKFEQYLILTDIEKEEEDRFILSSAITTYKSVEQATFVITNSEMAKQFRKLKNYSMIKVWGNIVSVSNSEIVEDSSDDIWGEENPMARLTGSYRKEMVITGADPSTIDNETFSDENISDAIKAMEKDENVTTEFGDDEKWGEEDKDNDEFGGW